MSSAFTVTAPFSVAINSSGLAYFPLDDAISSATYSSSNGLVAGGNGAAGTASAVPHRSQVDGAGNVFWTDLTTNGLLFEYTPPASGKMSTGIVVSFLPCFAYPSGSTYDCITTANQNKNNSVYTPTDFRAVGIDSAGDVWYAADAGYGAVIETLGVAAPTWPLLSYGHPGCKPGTGTTACP